MKLHNYLFSILLILAGAVLIVYADIDIEFICKFVAGVASIITYFVRDAAESYYRLDLVYGIMALFLALVFITKREEIGEYFPIMIGCVLVANGVVKLQHAIDMKRMDRKMKKVAESWLIVIIFSILCTAAGVIAIYLPPSDERTLFIFVGIAFIVAGITDIYSQIVFNKKVKTFKAEGESAGAGDAGSQDTDPHIVDNSDIAENTPEEASSEDAAGPQA